MNEDTKQNSAIIATITVKVGGDDILPPDVRENDPRRLAFGFFATPAMRKILTKDQLDGILDKFKVAMEEIVESSKITDLIIAAVRKEKIPGVHAVSTRGVRDVSADRPSQEVLAAIRKAVESFGGKIEDVGNGMLAAVMPEKNRRDSKSIDDHMPTQEGEEIIATADGPSELSGLLYDLAAAVLKPEEASADEPKALIIRCACKGKDAKTCDPMDHADILGGTRVVPESEVAKVVAETTGHKFVMFDGRVHTPILFPNRAGEGFSLPVGDRLAFVKRAQMLISDGKISDALVIGSHRKMLSIGAQASIAVGGTPEVGNGSGSVN